MYNVRGIQPTVKGSRGLVNQLYAMSVRVDTAAASPSIRYSARNACVLGFACFSFSRFLITRINELVTLVSQLHACVCARV